MAADDQSAYRAAQVVRNAVETLKRVRGKPAALWDDMTPGARNTEIARMQAVIVAGTYTSIETDGDEFEDLDEAVMGIVLPDVTIVPD